LQKIENKEEMTETRVDEVEENETYILRDMRVTGSESIKVTDRFSGKNKLKILSVTSHPIWEIA